MGINPFYTAADLITVRALFQHSEHIPEGISNGNNLDKTTAGGKGQQGGLQLFHQGHSTTTATPYYESRTTVEAAYQHHFSEQLMATVTLPAVAITARSATTLRSRGIGDITLFGHYISASNAPGSVPYVLMVGAGVQLPTGATDLTDDHGVRLPQEYQIGSGSVDVLANLRGTIQLRDWTLAADAMGTLNTSNARRDQQGNSIAITATVNRDLYRNNQLQLAVVGLAGGRLESIGTGKIAGTDDAAMAATSGYLQLGTEVRYGSIGAECLLLAPVLQHRTPTAPNEGIRWSAGLRYEL
ncbi:MAG: hypothetical protein IPM61_11710 [Chlorobi bacterium]|nr:hypothetical protein [Chlorobiota bacterium]MBX7215382.1 transporter [Candidatus Kapabacteria bacterium]